MCNTKLKLNYHNLKRNLPKIVDQIKQICEHHKDEKGIIHTHNNTITSFLLNKLIGSRFLIREPGVRNEEILEQQISSKTLSSGQMQKVSRIRAFLRNPDILFLDEATSNLDIKSVDLVRKELNKFSGTIINISHKMTQFPEADNIFKIEDKLIKYIS